MIRLQLVEKTQHTKTTPDGDVDFEETQILYLQEWWGKNDAPDVKELIGFCNGLSTGPGCTCGHADRHHAQGTGRCEVYRCNCNTFKAQADVALGRLADELRTARKDLATVAQQRDMALGKLDQRVDHLVQATQRGDRAVARLAKLKAEWDI